MENIQTIPRFALFQTLLLLIATPFAFSAAKLGPRERMGTQPIQRQP
jgi:hypothetical protein